MGRGKETGWGRGGGTGRGAASPWGTPLFMVESDGIKCDGQPCSLTPELDGFKDSWFLETIKHHSTLSALIPE